MDFNCMNEGETPNWKKYCHFYVKPCIAVDLDSDGKRIEFQPVTLEEMAEWGVKPEVWTVFGLTYNGEIELIHDSGSREQASEVVKHCLLRMNEVRSPKLVANEVLCHFKFDLKDFDPYKYDYVESRSVKFYPESGVYEECHSDDDPTSWSVYGHLIDQEIGGCECIHDCATKSEMKQLAWVLATTFDKN